MIISLYRDGRAFAEDVPYPEIAAAVGHAFLPVYSPPRLLRHFQGVLMMRLDGMDHLVCLTRMKANSTPSGSEKRLAHAGAGHGCGVGGGEYLACQRSGPGSYRVTRSFFQA